jgi:hypothetical protein
MTVKRSGAVARNVKKNGLFIVHDCHEGIKQRRRIRFDKTCFLDSFMYSVVWCFPSCFAHFSSCWHDSPHRFLTLYTPHREILHDWSISKSLLFPILPYIYSDSPFSLQGSRIRSQGSLVWYACVRWCDCAECLLCPVGSLRCQRRHVDRSPCQRYRPCYQENATLAEPIHSHG